MHFTQDLQGWHLTLPRLRQPHPVWAHPKLGPTQPFPAAPPDQPSLGGAAAQFGEWSLKLWNKIKICSRNQPTTLRRRRRGLERADPSIPNHSQFCSSPTPVPLAQGHPGQQPLGVPRAWSWHCFHSTKEEKKGEKKPQVNKKEPICKYCKECVFSYVLLLSPLVSYQQTSCQLGEVPAYSFFPVKCFSMPERIKMNVNEVY